MAVLSLKSGDAPGSVIVSIAPSWRGAGVGVTGEMIGVNGRTYPM